MEEVRKPCTLKYYMMKNEKQKQEIRTRAYIRIQIHPPTPPWKASTWTYENTNLQKQEHTKTWTYENSNEKTNQEKKQPYENTNLHVASGFPTTYATQELDLIVASP